MHIGGWGYNFFNLSWWPVIKRTGHDALILGEGLPLTPRSDCTFGEQFHRAPISDKTILIALSEFYKHV